MDPPTVTRARRNAERSGFAMSSDDRTGLLLATLAAAVPTGGAVLELGTGMGVGTAWITAGLEGRLDVRIVTVDREEPVSLAARDNDWPPTVEFVVGDAESLLPSLGTFDLIFADAQGGKWSGLDRTIGALRPGGFLLVDDMAPQPGWTPEHRANNERVRVTLNAHPALIACPMDWSTGLVLCVRRREVVPHAAST